MKETARQRNSVFASSAGKAASSPGRNKTDHTGPIHENERPPENRESPHIRLYQCSPLFCDVCNQDRAAVMMDME